MLFEFFYYSKKIDQRNCMKFCVKKKIKSARTFEMLTVAFVESTISGLSKAEKISMTMLILVARACQQPMKTLK